MGSEDLGQGVFGGFLDLGLWYSRNLFLSLFQEGQERCQSRFRAVEDCETTFRDTKKKQSSKITAKALS